MHAVVSYSLWQLPKQDIDTISAECRALGNRTSGVRRSLSGLECGETFLTFCKEADQRATDLCALATELQTVVRTLADFYVSDPKDIVGELRFFVERVLQASRENTLRLQEEQRRKELAQRQEATRSKHHAAAHRRTSPPPSMVDDLLLLIRDQPVGNTAQPQTHPAQPRRRRRQSSVLTTSPSPGFGPAGFGWARTPSDLLSPTLTTVPLKAAASTNAFDSRSASATDSFPRAHSTTATAVVSNPINPTNPPHRTASLARRAARPQSIAPRSPQLAATLSDSTAPPVGHWFSQLDEETVLETMPMPLSPSARKGDSVEFLRLVSGARDGALLSFGSGPLPDIPGLVEEYV